MARGRVSPGVLKLVKAFLVQMVRDVRGSRWGTVDAARRAQVQAWVERDDELPLSPAWVADVVGRDVRREIRTAIERGNGTCHDDRTMQGP